METEEGKVPLHFTYESFREQSGLDLDDTRQRNFFHSRIRPYLNKGTLSNVSTFLIMLIGIILTRLAPEAIIGQFIFNFGLFGFSGGITNWLAIRMLFDRIPLLYGSGVIPRRFKEIRQVVKNTIMKTFFDEAYLQSYLKQKTAQLSQTINLEEKLTQLLKSPEVEAVVEKNLAELSTRPEGAMFALMGMNPIMLKPMIMPFVIGMGTELVTMLGKNLDPAQLIGIGRIRSEIDELMTTKLEELTPNKVKQLIEDVIQEHLGWLIIWGNIFGGLIGIATKLFDLFI